jgi:hypothetical protein
MNNMYGKTYDYYAPVDMQISDYDVPGYPGLTLVQAELSVDVDYLNEDAPYIDTITLIHPDSGKYTKVTKDHQLGFLLAIMNNDDDLMSSVCSASHANAQ